MPPKSKFTREEIIAAAFEIASKEGISSVTARTIGAKLNSSARPIFTVFKSMEELLQEVALAARALYNEYIKKGLKDEIPFRGVGKHYIKFALEQPKLFQLLFMSEHSDHLTVNSLPDIDDNYNEILESVTRSYGVTGDDALRLYQQLWIYTHGIASLCATRTLEFTGKEIAEMLAEASGAIIAKIKSKRKLEGEEQNDKN